MTDTNEIKETLEVSQTTDSSTGDSSGDSTNSSTLLTAYGQPVKRPKSQQKWKVNELVLFQDAYMRNQIFRNYSLLKRRFIKDDGRLEVVTPIQKKEAEKFFQKNFSGHTVYATYQKAYRLDKKCKKEQIKAHELEV